MAASPRDRLRAAKTNGSPVSRTLGEEHGRVGAPIVERTVRITVDLPESLHKSLRVRVARDGITTQTFVRRQLEQALAAELTELSRGQVEPETG